MADITSYDYDAPMTESGDPNGEKYSLIKDVIEDHFDLVLGAIPEPSLKIALPSIEMKNIGSLISDDLKLNVAKNVKFSQKPLTFEQLRQFSGLILYETIVNSAIEINPTILSIDGLRDRAIILINGEVVGILSRENAVYSMPISIADTPFTLQIFVENQGRINFNDFNDRKVGDFLKLYSYRLQQ